MDWLLERNDHRVFLGTTIGTEPCTDLDFANDVALLTKMLSQGHRRRGVAQTPTLNLGGIQYVWPHTGKTL